MSRACILTLLALTIAGCGGSAASQVGSSTTGTTPGDGAAAIPVTAPHPTTPAAERFATVASVHRGAGTKQLVITLARLPATASPVRCQISVDVQVYENPREITLSILPRVGSGFDAKTCPLTAIKDYPETLTQPLGNRAVSFNVIGVVQRYVPNAAGVYAECRLPACDPSRAISEPAACANLRSFAYEADAPKNFDMVDVRCDGHWAVYGLDYGSGSCPPGDGAARSCAGVSVHRIYWKADGDTWKIVARDDSAGCGDVLAAVPDFPRSLCVDLAAIR